MKKLMITITILICACSNQGVYEGMQASQRMECLKLPESQYEECMERANKSYDEYERQRQEAITSK